ncbi:hypothetical protein AAC387_Pa11g0809 [Persea americana]
MSYSRRSSDRRSFSRSLSRSRSCSRSYDSSDVDNPGNNLYVTGLSSRVTTRDLEKHFSSEGGKVVDIHLVVLSLWRRVAVCSSSSPNFKSLTTTNQSQIKLPQANIRLFNQRARRRRGRTPTPGRYLGAKTINGRRRSPSYSPYRHGRYGSPHYSSERDRSYSPYYRRRRSHYSGSPCYSSERDRSYSPYYSRGRSSYRSPNYYSPGRDRSYSPYYTRRRSAYRYPSYSLERGRPYSPDYRYSYKRSPSSRRDRYSRKRSVSPHYRRDYRCVSFSASPSAGRSSSPSTYFPRKRQSLSRSASPRRSAYSRSYSHSCSSSSRSRSLSESRSPLS